MKRALTAVPLIAVVVAAAGCGSSRVAHHASATRPPDPLTKKVVACERSGKLVCDPVAYKRDQREGLFPLSKPDPKGAQVLTLRQVLPPAWKGKDYAAKLMTYGQAHEIAPGLTGATSAAVDPSRKVWVLNLYYHPPIKVSDVSWSLSPGVTPRMIRVREEAQVDDAVTGGAIDSCVNCRALPDRIASDASSGSGTPANQPALDSAAGYALRIAGAAHCYTGAVVDDASNHVILFLAHPSSSVLRKLRAGKPGIYVIHNDAPRTLRQVMALQSSLGWAYWKSRGIHIVQSGPTQTGYLQVGVSSSVKKAQAAFDAKYGRGVIRVVHAEPAVLLSRTG